MIGTIQVLYHVNKIVVFNAIVSLNNIVFNGVEVAVFIFILSIVLYCPSILYLLRFSFIAVMIVIIVLSVSISLSKGCNLSSSTHGISLSLLLYLLLMLSLSLFTPVILMLLPDSVLLSSLS